MIAFILRLIPVLLTRSLGIGLDDMFQYDMLARSLASGNGYRWYAYDDLKMLEPYVDFDLSSVDYDPVRGVPTSFRAPLYPAFLALIYYLTGAGAGRFFAVRLVQAGLSALLAPLTYLVSRRIFPDPSSTLRTGNKPASVIAAWIVACYPLLIIYPIGLATENLFFLLVLIAFYFLLQIPDSRLPIPNSHSSTLYSLLSGFFLALAALTRSVILPFAGLAVLWVWFILKQKRGAVLMALTMLVLITPWVLRNSLLHQKLTGIESSMGYNLYVGYHPDSNGSFTFGVSLDLIPILDDATRDQIGIQKALEFISAEPERILPLALNRLGFFFGLEKRALMYFYSNNLLGYIPKPLLLTIAAVLLLPFVFVAPPPLWDLLSPAFVRVRFCCISCCLLTSCHMCLSCPKTVFTWPSCLIWLSWLPKHGLAAGARLTVRWRESLAGKVAVSLAILAVMLLFLNWGFELSRDADKIAALLSPGGNQTHFPY